MSKEGYSAIIKEGEMFTRYILRFGKLVWDALLSFQRIIMVICITIFTALICTEVLFRYILHKPLYGIEEIAAYAAFWLYFMGGAHGAFQRNHISASIISVAFKKYPKIELFITTVTNLLTTVVCVWMTILAYDFFIWGLQRHERSLELNMLMAWFQSPVFFGLALMSLYFFVEFIDHFLQLYRNKGLQIDLGDKFH